MTPFEYLLLFAAIILGLAVSELAIACHRLVGASARVRWDWLSPLAAILVFLKIITQWWSWYAAQSLPGGLRFEMFIGVIVGGVLLFLLAAMALPDVRESNTEVNLAEHYERVRRRFWLLFAVHWVVVTAVSTWAQVVVAGAHFSGVSLVYLIVPVAVALAYVRSRWLHGAALLGLGTLYIVQFLGRQLVQQ
ncbi:MAG: hypothetical protein U0163_17570 [Gemmatimonadaceae bacterium]